MAISAVPKIFIVFIILLHATALYADDEQLIVTLPYGKIRGQVIETDNEKKFYAFQEIPYASPPVNELRFKDPVPPKEWEDILETTENSKICYQQDVVFAAPNATESEDCLYLNVYTPQGPKDSYESLLPVLFWIHGGGYVSGGGTYQQYGPSFIMEYDIVVVTINYRLGPLGFLSTGDGVISGNFGLKDQNFALQWVQDNIRLFGGDPEKVTVAGEDAGAFSVSFHLISPKSKALFRAAIQQSGTSLSPWSYQPFYRHIAFSLGKVLDPSFSSEDSTDLLHLLKSKSAADITNAKISIAASKDNAGSLWAPMIEFDGREGSFLTGPMHETIKARNINQVPLLLGYNSEEEILFSALDLSKSKNRGALFDADITKLLRLTFNMTEENRRISGDELRRIYTDITFQEDFNALVEYMSDFRFTTPIIRDAHLQSKYSDVYLYQLSYKGNLLGINVKLDGVDPRGVAHTEDLLYMWDVGSNSVSSLWTDGDVLTRNRILKMWTNFVKYLNPTPERDGVLQNVIWTKVSSDDIEFMDIGSSLEIKTNPKKYKQWKQIIDEYAAPPFTAY